MEATTPELGPVGLWSPKSSSFSSSDSIVVEEAARNFQSPHFLLGMPFDRLVRGRTSLRERAQ